MQTRRRFVFAVAGAGASTLFARGAHAMQQPAPTMSGPMEQDAYRPVRLAAKPGAGPSMTDQARDDLEHQIKCQCGCVLDIFTCRTTDFSCAVSPAMHGDVVTLVSSGYTAPEILGAFREVYGARAMMAPPREGFNLLGYIMPFAVLFGGVAVVAGMMRKWRTRAIGQPPTAAQNVDATDAELEAVKAAVMNDR